MILAVDTCLNSVRAWRLVGIFLLVVRIVVPLIIIITGIFPVFSALIKGTADDSIKSIKTIGKKLLAGLVVFYIPSLITSFVNLVVNNDEPKDVFVCTTCLEDPRGDICNNYVDLFEDLQRSEIINFEDQVIEGQLNTNDLEDAPPASSAGGLGANSVSDKTSYGNLTLNVVKAVETNYDNPDSGLGDGRNRYRAVQSAVYTGKYVVYAQNRNYGSIDSSSNGGRICWSELETGKFVKCVEIGSEGGHMDGLAYDADRGYILKMTTNGNLLVFDNSTMQYVGHSNIPSYSNALTYIPSIHMLVSVDGGNMVFYKYNQDSNTYERDHVVHMENFDANLVQGAGTDGTNVFVADSSPWASKRNLYTYSLDGKRLEVHSFGSGFGSMSSEVEAAFADNKGILYLACPQGIARVTNYTANKIGLKG